MATDTQHLEGIRLQAERVVRAYTALRTASKNLDLTSDDFSVGQLGELFQQVRQLDHWLQPVEGEQPAGDSGSDNDAEDEPDDRPEITVLLGDHCDTIYGLNGIIAAIVALDEPESVELAIAARELSKRLYSDLGNLRSDAAQKIERATGMKVRQ